MHLKYSLLIGLQNYWTFDYHTNDTIGAANLGNGASASFVTDGWGNINSAVYLNSSYYSAPPGIYFRGDHTIAAWTKVIAISAWARIIDFGIGTYDNILLSISQATSGNPVSSIYNSTRMNQYALSNLTLQINKWTHLAHTFSNKTCKIYFNGTLTGTAACNAPRSVTRSNCYIGKSNWPGDGLLNAHIDELRIYNRALNLTEINQLVAYIPTGNTTTTTTTSTTTSKTSSTTTMSTTTYSITSTTSTTSSTSASSSTTEETPSTTTSTSTKTSISSSTSKTTSTSTYRSEIDTNIITSTTQTSSSPIIISASSTSASYSLSTISDISSLNSVLFTNSFNIVQLHLSQTMFLLNSNYDLNGCIVNCSNNGQCKFDSLINDFICSCNSIYLSGYACQIDTRPCSSNPCLNNATCVDYSNSSFSCVCDMYHNGAYCESEIDICQNETCSSNGNCFDLNKLAKCKCFNMYSGERCELESNELKTAKQITSSVVIFAIAIISFFYIFVVLMDVSKLLCKKPSRVKKPIIQEYKSYA